MRKKKNKSTEISEDSGNSLILENASKDFERLSEDGTLYIINLHPNQKKMRSERHDFVFLGKANPRKAILKRNLSQKTRTSALLKECDN